MKTLVRLGMVASTMWITTSAVADDKAACLDGASKGQTLRDEHKLVEARDQFRLCSRGTCPDAVRSDCANWLDAVERNLPTVVITVKDGAGAPIIGAKVSVDGQPLATKFDGEAIPMNPGPHTFHFEAPDGTKVDQQMVVSEGQQNQAVAEVLGLPVHADVLRPTQPAPVDSGARTQRTIGLALASVGIVGMVTGGVLALVAKSEYTTAESEHGNARVTDSAKAVHLANGVTVVVATAVILASTGAAIWFTTPRAPAQVGTNGREILLQRSF